MMGDLALEAGEPRLELPVELQDLVCSHMDLQGLASGHSGLGEAAQRRLRAIWARWKHYEAHALSLPRFRFMEALRPEVQDHAIARFMLCHGERSLRLTGLTYNEYTWVVFRGRKLALETTNIQDIEIAHDPGCMCENEMFNVSLTLSKPVGPSPV